MEVRYQTDAGWAPLGHKDQEHRFEWAVDDLLTEVEERVNLNDLALH